MATKEDIEKRAAECNTPSELAALAVETKAMDAEYAGELLHNAGDQCQMPDDHVTVAEAALSLNDKTYADELYEQAEEFSMEPMEFATLARSLAVRAGRKEKADELLQRAADEASQPKDILQIAALAQNEMGDKVAADKLIASLVEKARELEDYIKLAADIKEHLDEQSAREFYTQAARYCDGPAQTVRYAEGMIEVFEDRDWALDTLIAAETDCQFPKEFADLAEGFKRLFDDSTKVEELIEQAAEFAMSGEEQLDLGNAYWTLLQAKDKAAEAYEKALPDLNDKDQLLELAGRVASELEVRDLAKQMYAKAEEKMTSAPERIKLAEAVLRDTADRAFTLEVYQRAAESLTQPNDLMSLAGNIVDQLQDKENATPVYRKALESLSALSQYLNLAEQANEKLSDKALTREILVKAGELAAESPDFLALAQHALSLLDDTDLSQEHLQSAEEQVTSIGELSSVLEAVKTHFAGDRDWIAQVEDKLAKREANQEKYAVFQEREKQAETTIKRIILADDVMKILEDRFYTRKLLTEAEQTMHEEGYDFTKVQSLVRAVSRHLDDLDWAKRLLRDAFERCSHFVCVRLTADATLALLSDKDAAAELVRDFYRRWEERVDAADAPGAYAYTKLATAVLESFNDTAWAGKLIAKAGALAGDHFLFIHLSNLAARSGDAEGSRQWLDKAMEACSTPEQARQLATRLINTGSGSERVRDVYRDMRERMASPRETLTWVEGILGLFKDREWAKQEYDLLVDLMQTEQDRAALSHSRKLRLENRL